MEHSANNRQGKNRASKPGEPKSKTTPNNQNESKKSSLKEKRKNPETNVRANRKRKQPLPQPQNTIDKFFLPSTSNETPGPSKVKKGALQQQKHTGKNEAPTDFFDKKKDIATTKHGILSNYLGAWLSILSRDAAKRRGRWSYSRLVYVDGFAGPGRYKESGDTGSPLVAYTLALTHKNLPEDGPEIDMIFIEKIKEDSQKLLANLQQVKMENQTAKNSNL